MDIISNMRKLVFTATFVALASGLEIWKSYAGISLFAGFEPVTFIVALSGFLLGWRAGFSVGVLTNIVYSIFLGFYPSLLFNAFGFGMVGLLSGIFKDYGWNIINKSYSLALFALWGLLMAVIFNVISNGGWGLIYCYGQVEFNTCFESTLILGIVFNIRNFIWNLGLFSVMPLVLASCEKFRENGNDKGSASQI